MKKSILIFLMAILSFSSFSQDKKENTEKNKKVSLLFESNINYAPIGIKAIIINEEKGYGGYLTFKISEDIISRKTTGKTVDYDPNMALIDINKIVLGIGSVMNISENIDFYLGTGVMMGKKYSLDYSKVIIGGKSYIWANGDTWSMINESSFFPMLSSGLIVTKKKFKFTLGYEAAFVNDSHFNPEIDKKSFTKLSSFTFGVGYALN